MRYLMILLSIALYLSGCSGNDTGTGGSGSTSTESASGGSGNTSTESASGGGGSGGSGGMSNGGGGTAEIVIGPPDTCAGSASIAPIDGEAQDENGTAIHENGALACRRFVPPSYPFHVSKWQVEWAAAFCDGAPSALYFVQPADVSYPITLSNYTESMIDPNGDALVTFAPNVDLFAGEAFYGCLRLAITEEGRSCASACKNPIGTAPSPDALYSNTNASGTVTPLPAVDLEKLSMSPTPETGAAFGNDRLDWNTWIRGQ